MSVNKYRPHVFVLPEDDANRQLANGFHLELASIRQMQVERPAGGWNEVLKLFEEEHVFEMDRCDNRYMVLLIDFDGIEDRLQLAKERIPDRLADRVFIFGARTTPEALRHALREAGLDSFENIGKGLAEDCRNGTETVWAHPLLQHNAEEVERSRQHLLPILL